MKRFTASVLAAATALTLSTAAATAAEAEKSSSEISDLEAQAWAASQIGCDKAGLIGRGIIGTAGRWVDDRFTCEENTTSSYNYIKNKTSSNPDEIASSDLSKLKDSPQGSVKDGALSSVKSDMARGWQLGTTLDIAFYTGLTAAVLHGTLCVRQSPRRCLCDRG